MLLLFLLIGFLGYIIGRWADNYLNFWTGDLDWIPDHWIYGLALMIGSPFFEGLTAVLVFSFGLGHFISDLKDFMNLKAFGSDRKNKSSVRFWHID